MLMSRFGFFIKPNSRERERVFFWGGGGSVSADSSALHRPVTEGAALGNKKR